MQVSFHGATFTVIPAHLVLFCCDLFSAAIITNDVDYVIRLATHTNHVPVFSSAAFSTPANLVLHFPVLRFPFPPFQSPPIIE